MSREKSELRFFFLRICAHRAGMKYHIEEFAYRRRRDEDIDARGYEDRGSISLQREGQNALWSADPFYTRTLSTGPLSASYFYRVSALPVYMGHSSLSLTISMYYI